jgi:phenylpropionate dioxygenase-like ring-hydroxylating dioxygenase large terminal subunit
MEADRSPAEPREQVRFLGTEPIETRPYIDPRYFEVERPAIFRRTWLHVGRLSELAGADSFIVRDVSAAGVSVLLTRSSDGTIRAFHNVCTHRGSRLVAEEGGTARSFSCSYHMWNFANDGRLRAVPDEASFFALDKAQCGLVPMSVDTVAGFIFVNVDRAPAESLRDYLGAIAPELEELRFGELTDFMQYSCEVQSNWKTAFFNFQETYHVRWVHAPSAGGRATSPDNPYGYASNYRFVGRHSINTIRPPADPLLSDVQVQAYAAADRPPGGPGERCWDMFYLYPNLYLVPLNGSSPFTMQFWPMGPDRTRLVVRLYVPGPNTSASSLFNREYSSAYLMDVHVEDFEVLEANHRGLKSGALSHINLQVHEAVCRHFHNVVTGDVAAYLEDRRSQSTAFAP